MSLSGVFRSCLEFEQNQNHQYIQCKIIYQKGNIKLTSVLQTETFFSLYVFSETV